MKATAYLSAKSRPQKSPQNESLDRPNRVPLSPEVAQPAEEANEGNVDLSDLTPSSGDPSFEDSNNEEGLDWEESAGSGKQGEDVQALLTELSENAISSLKSGDNENALEYLKRSEQLLEVTPRNRTTSHCAFFYSFSSPHCSS